MIILLHFILLTYLTCLESLYDWLDWIRNEWMNERNHMQYHVTTLLKLQHVVNLQHWTCYSSRVLFPCMLLHEAWHMYIQQWLHRWHRNTYYTLLEWPVFRQLLLQKWKGKVVRMEALCTQHQIKDLEVKRIHICQYGLSTNNWKIEKWPQWP